VQPVRDTIRCLGALGPRNLRLAGEIADGFFSKFFAPEHAAVALDRSGPVGRGRPNDGGLRRGSDSAAGGRPRSAAAAEPVREHAALYRRMGTRQNSTTHWPAGWIRGGADGCSSCIGVGVRGRRRGRTDRVIDQTSLLGPAERIAERMRMHPDAGVTTLAVRPYSIGSRWIAACTPRSTPCWAGVAA
jgi:alkanesulfonate monooxygenase SsuD/methylene tetrahydromethanopterin reductase-like flavin-dependent oxidoreductase (luciferase family)